MGRSADQPLQVPPGRDIRLADFDAGFHEGLDRDAAEAETRRHCEQLDELAYRLFAEAKRAVIVVLQGIDTSGKDGTIRMLASGISPQCLDVKSFKAPSALELSHDFLWRVHAAVPAHGRIGIFNRSHYEEVLVARVHESILDAQKLPPESRGKSIWRDRYADINAFERHLTRNGVIILKFFLNVSFEEQARRFLERIDDPAKNWKFSARDVKERSYWKEYQAAYEKMLEATSTAWAPWWVVPADNKWFARLLVSDIIAMQLESMDIAPPKLSEQARAELMIARARLISELEQSK